MKNLEIYKKNLLLNYEKETIDYNCSSECLEYTASEDGTQLTICINPKSHIIENSKVKLSTNDKHVVGLMNAFRKLIIDLPILEAQDHSILRLENLLRDETAKHNVKGIIMPTNCCDIFNIPLILIRNLYKQYSQKNDYAPVVNTYRPNLINIWKNKSQNERESIISDNVLRFCKCKDIENYEIKLIGDMRVEFFVDKDEYPTLPELLFNMEKEIAKELGFSLEIMFVEKKDANRKRKNKNEK